MGRFIVLKVRGREEKHQVWVQTDVIGAVVREGSLIRLALRGDLAYVALDREGSAFGQITSALTNGVQEGPTVEVLVDDFAAERGK